MLHRIAAVALGLAITFAAPHSFGGQARAGVLPPGEIAAVVAKLAERAAKGESFSPSQALKDVRADYQMRATLYHGAVKGLSSRDSLGCLVAPMRTVAVDRKLIPARSVIFIKETVGLPMPGGGVHDGLWYASDTGGGVKGQKIDLFTGMTAGSMAPLMKAGLNLATLSVAKVGSFTGCPPRV